MCLTKEKFVDPWGWKIFMRKQCDSFFFLLRVRPKFDTVKEQFRRLLNSYLLHLFSSFQGYSNTRSAGNFCQGKILLRLYGRLGERRMFCSSSPLARTWSSGRSQLNTRASCDLYPNNSCLKIQPTGKLPKTVLTRAAEVLAETSYSGYIADPRCNCSVAHALIIDYKNRNCGRCIYVCLTFSFYFKRK